MFRRIIVWIVTLLAMAGAARASGPFCISEPGFAALVDEQGRELIESGRFETLFTVREGALYAAGDRSGYRLYDADGQPVTDEVYGMIHDAGDCLVFRRGERFGAMDESGAAIVEPAWTQLVSNGIGGFLARDGDPLDDQPDEIIYIDASGEARRTGVFSASGLAEVRDDRMPYMASDGRFGAVDSSGEGVIPAVWRYIGAFSGGVAAAADGNGYGVLDAQGNAVVAMRYDWLDRSEAVIVGLDEEDGIDVYAADGSRLLFSLPGAGLRAALVGACLSVTGTEQARLFDAEGDLLYAASAGAVFYPGTDGQFILADGAWGESCQRILNPDGSETADGFQRLLPLAAGRYAWMLLPGVRYYSADLGGLQTSWNYDDMRWGLADAAGDRLTDAEYLEIRALAEDRLLLLTENEVILADADGAGIRRWALAESEGSNPGAGA